MSLDFIQLNLTNHTSLSTGFTYAYTLFSMLRFLKLRIGCWLSLLVTSHTHTHLTTPRHAPVTSFRNITLTRL